MSDFMQWLYAHYIKPSLDDVPQDGCEMCLAMLDGGLTAEQGEVYQKSRESTAIHAFLLGLRTGEGLAPLTPR